MKLYFLRHAEAEEGPVDDQRELTAKGRDDARRLGKHLGKLGLSLDLAFSSPLIRAVQTAELVLKSFAGKRPKLEQTEALTNAATVTTFRRWLRKLPDVESILVVGHEPSLSSHLRALLSLENTAGLPLVKCGFARVDTSDRKRGTLRWLIGPKQTP